MVPSTESRPMIPFLDTLNGADLVACGILAIIALWVVLWAIMECAPRLFRRALSAFARWHARQIIKANTPVRWEDWK